MRFSQKYSEKNTVYQKVQNLYQLVKYSLIKNGIGYVMSDLILHVNMTPLTVEQKKGRNVENIIV